jgi:hypothetical protein
VQVTTLLGCDCARRKGTIGEPMNAAQQIASNSKSKTAASSDWAFAPPSFTPRAFAAATATPERYFDPWQAARLTVAGVRPRTSREAQQGAEQLRPLFAELAGLSARKVADELNRRSVATPAGGKWHAATVLRVRERLT